jgi:hypothetical protein
VPRASRAEPNSQGAWIPHGADDIQVCVRSGHLGDETDAQTLTREISDELGAVIVTAAWSASRPNVTALLGPCGCAAASPSTKVISTRAQK